MARPSKRNPEIIEAVERCLRAGSPWATAACHASVDPSTLRRWVAADQKLRIRLAKAEADAVASFAGRILQGAAQHPAAAVKYLQLRHPILFGRHRLDVIDVDPLDFSQPETPTSPAARQPGITDLLPEAYLDEYVSLLLAAKRGDDPREWHANRLMDRLAGLREEVSYPVTDDEAAGESRTDASPGPAPEEDAEALGGEVGTDSPRDDDPDGADLSSDRGRIGEELP